MADSKALKTDKPPLWHAIRKKLGLDPGAPVTAKNYRPGPGPSPVPAKRHKTLTNSVPDTTACCKTQPTASSLSSSSSSSSSSTSTSTATDKKRLPLTPIVTDTRTNLTHSSIWKLHRLWDQRTQTQVKFTIPNNFSVLNLLGSGSFGVVCSCERSAMVSRGNQHSHQTIGTLAVKQIGNLFQDGPKQTVPLLRELQILRHLSSQTTEFPGLVRYHGTLPVQTARFDTMHLMFDKVDTNLNAAMAINDIKESHVQYIMYRLLCTIRYIHAAKIMHRDIKTTNILVTGQCEPFLCDFGSAIAIPPSLPLSHAVPTIHAKTAPVLTDYIMTRWYRAPEVEATHHYDEKIDLWSAGCVMAEMMAKAPLFTSDHDKHLLCICQVLGYPSVTESKQWNWRSAARQMVLAWNTADPNIVVSHATSARIRLRAKFSATLFSDACIDVLSHLLDMNPAQRWSAATAIEHPWFDAIRERVWEAGPLPTMFVPSTDDGNIETEYGLRNALWRQVLMDHPHLYPMYEQWSQVATPPRTVTKASTAKLSPLLPAVVATVPTVSATVSVQH